MGRFGAGGEIQLTIEIEEFRLRTHPGAYQGGVFAGADTLRVRCEVTRTGGAVTTFKSGTSSALGGPQYQYEDYRLDRLGTS